MPGPWDTRVIPNYVDEFARGLQNRFPNNQGFLGTPRSNFSLQGRETIFPPDSPNILEPRIEQVPPDFLQRGFERRREINELILKYLLGGK